MIIEFRFNFSSCHGSHSIAYAELRCNKVISQHLTIFTSFLHNERIENANKWHRKTKETILPENEYAKQQSDMTKWQTAAVKPYLSGITTKNEQRTFSGAYFQEYIK